MNRLFARSVGVVGARGLLGRATFFRATPAMMPAALVVPSAGRRFASSSSSEKSVAELVTTAEKHLQLARMLEEEVQVMQVGIQDAESGATPYSESTDRLLKKLGFEVHEIPDEGLIKLTKVVGDKSVTVIFNDSPDETDEADAAEDENNEHEEKDDDDADDKEEEDDDHVDTLLRDYPFTVELKRVKSPETFTFSGNAQSDGALVVTTLTVDDCIPVQIALWSDEMQRELINYLDSFGIGEDLANFIDRFLMHRAAHDGVKVMRAFKEFVSK